MGSKNRPGLVAIKGFYVICSENKSEGTNHVSFTHPVYILCTHELCNYACIIKLQSTVVMCKMVTEFYGAIQENTGSIVYADWLQTLHKERGGWGEILW